MIVPFDRRQQQASPLPQVPEKYLLAALGQAHAEGKFHVYDPRLQFQEKGPSNIINPDRLIQSPRPGGIDPLRVPPPSDRPPPKERGI